MTILNNLMEKKDILLYLRFRIRRLNQERRERIKNYPEKDRERISKLLEVRIKELDRLLQRISENKLKEDCKEMWRHFEGKKELERLERQQEPEKQQRKTKKKITDPQLKVDLVHIGMAYPEIKTLKEKKRKLKELKIRDPENYGKVLAEAAILKLR